MKDNLEDFKPIQQIYIKFQALQCYVNLLQNLRALNNPGTREEVIERSCRANRSYDDWHAHAVKNPYIAEIVGYDIRRCVWLRHDLFDADLLLNNFQSLLSVNPS